MLVYHRVDWDSKFPSSPFQQQTSFLQHLESEWKKTWFCETVGCNGIFYQEYMRMFNWWVYPISWTSWKPKIGIFSIGIGVRCAQFSGHLSDWMVVNSLRMWQMPWLLTSAMLVARAAFGSPIWVSLGWFHMLLLMQKTKKTKRFHVSLVGQTKMKSCDSWPYQRYFCCCFAPWKCSISVDM